MAERGVAPACVLRKHTSGTPRVAVRPNYVGLPTPGLDEGRTNGAKAPGSGGRRVRCLDPGSYGPGAQNRCRGAPSGARPAIRTPAPQGVDFKGAARRSAPSRL